MIRYATPVDTAALLCLARMMHAESPRFHHLAFDAEKTAAMLGNLIENPQAVALVDEKEGQIVGMMGGFVMEHLFGHDKVAADIGLYVVPQYRGTSTAPRLLRAFEDWAKENGARDIVLGISTEVTAEATRGLYMKLGYEQSGYLMRKEIHHV